MSKSLLLLVFFGIISNACVTTLSQENLDGIKNVQILTNFDDDFYISDVGLTVFENDSYQGKPSDWQLKTKILESLQANIPANINVVDQKPFDASREFYEGWGSDLAIRMRNEAQAVNADTIIILAKRGWYNPAGGGYWEVPSSRGGFGFHSKSLLGKPILTCAFLSYSISVYRVADGKNLASDHETICENQSKVESMKEFEAYSTEEKAYFKEAIEFAIQGRFAEKVKSVFTPVAAPTPAR